MRLKITHVTGCYSLVVAESFGNFRKDHVIQTSFYVPGDHAEKLMKLTQMRAFANGVIEGFDMARYALQHPYVANDIEEYVLPEGAAK